MASRRSEARSGWPIFSGSIAINCSKVSGCAAGSNCTLAMGLPSYSAGAAFSRIEQRAASTGVLIHQPSRVNTRDHLNALPASIRPRLLPSGRMNPRDRERYSRQILFSGVGKRGQQYLLDARVAVAGCGALGSFQAGALARAGIGFLRIIDRDYVELSNLQRQWLFDECDVKQGMPKAAAAARKIAGINGGVEVEPVVADLTPSNVEDLLGGVDLILDGTDNFETRYLMNDFAVDRGVPWVYGAAVGSYGIAMPVVPGTTA